VLSGGGWGGGPGDPRGVLFSVVGGWVGKLMVYKWNFWVWGGFAVILVRKWSFFELF
jgi:hypothetical protein